MSEANMLGFGCCCCEGNHCQDAGGITAAAACSGGAPSHYTVTFAASLDCCDSHLENGLTLTHSSGSIWLGPNTVCNGDTSQPTLTVGDGVPSTLTVNLNNGHTITYEKVAAWQCLCGNLMTLTSDPADCPGLPATVCVLPLPLDHVSCSTFCTDGIPYEWLLTVAGISDTDCGLGSGSHGCCDAANGTFILEQQDGVPGNPCFWYGPQTAPGALSCHQCFGPQWLLHFVNTGSPATSYFELRLSYYSPSGPEPCVEVAFARYKLLATAWDCDGPNTLTLIDNTTCCTNLPATVTVEPVL